MGLVLLDRLGRLEGGVGVGVGVGKGTELIISFLRFVSSVCVVVG